MSVSAADQRVLGRPIKGPSALGDDPRRMFHLTLTLSVMEFKLRFFGSVLGYFWSLARPLMLFGVLYVVFTEFVRLGDGVPFYPAILLTSIVLFMFFSEATAGSLKSVVDRESLVRKIEFPRLVVPLAVILTSFFNLVLNLVAVLVFVLATGVRPKLEWLALPLLLILLVALVCGVAMILSSLYVRFRDLSPIWDVVLQVLFYGSPILYVLELLPSDRLAQLIPTLNPFATILVQARHTLIDPSAPNAWDAVGGFQYLAIPGAMIAVLLVGGLWLFNREAPRIAEEL